MRMWGFLAILIYCYRHACKPKNHFSSFCFPSLTFDENLKILIEVFINYDCEPEAVNLYAQIVESLSKIAKGPGIGMGGRENPGTASGSPSFREETYNLQNLALDTLVKILTSLLHALGETTTTPDHNIEPSTAIAISNDAGNEDSNDESSYEEADELNAAAIQVEDQHHHQEQPINGMVNGSSHHDSAAPSHDVMSHTNALRSKKSMDDEISSRLWKFNVNPVEEIESLQACGALGMTPADVAQFLHSWSGKLDKTTIGDYLCYENGSPKGDGEDDFNALVLQEYINQLDFEGHSIDNALRMFVCGFRLSEEYKIEWVMKKFVERYCLQNPNTFTSEERAFVLVNSAILLSISLQNSVKKQRWTVERFINENKDDEDGGEQQQLLQLGGSGDDDISYLRDMFYRIKKDPIVVVAHSSRTSTNVIHAYDRKKKMDELLSNGILRFNLNPGKGVDRLQACGAVGKTPADVARFLHSWSEKLDKAAIGDYLSREKEYKGGFNVLVLHEYVDQMVFSDLRFDDAIRYYLSGFRLPGEAQKIDRMMEKFAERYCLQNPAVFPSADTAFILAFSIIMLNTDLHNPAIKEERRMTVEGFIGNNRGIGDGSNLDEGFLRDIFDSIKNNPIRLKEDDELREQLVVGNDSSPHGLGLGLGLVYGLTGMTSTADRAKREAAYSKERVDMLRSSQALFRERRQEKLDAAAENNPPASQALSRTSHSGRMINESVGKLASVQEDGEGGDRNKFLVPDIALGEADALAYVRAMFDVAWWPMLGAFSQVLEECCGQSTGELYSPEGVGRVMVEHCLEGCRLGLRLSARCVGGGSFPISMPDNVDGSSENGPRPLAHNISREAFVNTLGKFTLLEGIYNNTMQEMHPHHLRCISTLLVIAREDGEYLEESWGCVLRLLSQLVRLLILAEGLASDGEFFESPSQGSSSFMERRGSMNTIVKRTNRAKVKGAAKWQMSNAALIQAEISMELIDRIFTNSINLSTSGIHYLVHHLCSISHLELNPESSVVPPTLKEGGGDSSSSAIQAPRIFALQKLVEVADFNMDVRGRLVWAGIWETLSGHFSEIGAHENPQLAMYAIDSLRQLAMKFMVKEELRDFNFQRVVLRPFEAITATGNCTEEHVTFILHCIEQLVQATGKSIRSGWKSVLSILSTAIRGWSLATTNLAWGILQKIVEEEFSALSYDFLDIIKCLLSVLQKEDSEEMSLLAVKSLCRCANFLGRGKGKDGSSNTQNENGKTANLSVLTPPPHPHLHDRSKRFNQSTTSSTMRYKTLEGVSSNNPDEVSEEAHLTLWWPLLFGLSESVEDRRKEVRHACLDALTTILEEYGSPFSTQTWLLLLKAVLFPIFENTATDLVQQPSSYSPTADTFPPSSSEESSSTHDGSAEAVVGSSSNIAQAYSSSWTAVTAPLALQTCCRILVAHPSRLFPLFSDILGVYKSCICQEREGLARIGVKGLVYLIQELEKKCPDAVVEQNEGGGDEITKTVWYCITDFLCDIMQYNFPTDFLEKVITTTPPSNSPQLLSWEELEDVITVPTSPSGLMTMMVVSQQLVCAVRDMLLMFGRKGRSSFISLLGARNIKCLVEMISKSTAIYWSFNDCLPLRVSLAQDNFMLHLDGKKNKGYSSTANQEYNSWIAEVQLAVVLGLGVDFENGEKIKDPQNLEGACDDELIRIFTSVVACYCRRQEILRSFREVKSEAEEDDEVAVHASIMLENMDSMTPTVVEVLKMLQYLSADQFQENVACIYSTLVKLIRSDSILVRDAVQEIMSNRLQVFIHEIQTVVSSRPQMHQAVIQ